jgi:FixJ family two-component response regulator
MLSGEQDSAAQPQPEKRVKRAYIVDDDQGFRKSLEFLLSSHGWTVEGFGSP